jgi:tetratricopeptide (TPR) repeat protein
VGGTPGPSRFIFTSRIDFNPLEDGRIPEAIHHLALPEMQFRDAVYLMETLPALARLPVAFDDELDPSSSPISAPKSHDPLSLRSIYRRLGGHPYTLSLFGRDAQNSSPEQVFENLAGVQKELLEFTLLDRAVEALSQRARDLLHKAAIFDEPVPMQGLAYVFSVSDVQDEQATTDQQSGESTEAQSYDGRLQHPQAKIPNVEEEVRSLVSWGLLTCPVALQGEERLYSVPTPVRSWALGGSTLQVRRQLWEMAANYWLAVAGDSQDLDDYLVARHYLFLAGQYEAAAVIVDATAELLHRWGHIELLLKLLDESISTTDGHQQAVATINKSIVYERLGFYAQAAAAIPKVIEVFKQLGDRDDEAELLYHLGRLHYQQGEYEQSRQLFQQSLVIWQELGDSGDIAKTLHHLGMLHEEQGEYEQARQLFQQSLALYQEVKDRSRMSATLGHLGILHHFHGEYEQARELYQQAFDIAQEFGDYDEMASSQHHLGMLHQEQGEYEQAWEMFQQSLAIRQRLGNRKGAATTLYQLGSLHYQQGEYEQARQLFQQSLTIYQELGNPGIALPLYGMGMVHQEQGEYEQAWEMFQQSHALYQELGNRGGVASNLRQLGLINENVGRPNEAVVLIFLAFDLLKQMGMPEWNQAGHDLIRLREQMGEEAFNEALREVFGDEGGKNET